MRWAASIGVCGMLLLGPSATAGEPVRIDQARVEASARRMVEQRAQRAQERQSGVSLSKVAHREGSAEDTKPGPAPSAPVPVAGKDPLSAMMSGSSGGASTSWAIVVGLTLLTLLPAFLLAMTPMVRLLVVFHFLRQALGTQTAPSNQILMGLSLMMTWFLMAPVLGEVEAKATTPYRQGTITAEEAISRGIVPVKTYMLRYAREKDLAVFAAAGMATRPKTKEELPFQVVVPAYMLSELKAGFTIGAVLFLPFLLVDLVVASVTTSIGMLQLPPVVISTPVKILLFVMVDGWNLLADKLLRSF